MTPRRPASAPVGPVRCALCAHASAFIGNGCFCAARQTRVCAANRYGRVCTSFEPIKNKIL